MGSAFETVLDAAFRERSPSAGGCIRRIGTIAFRFPRSRQMTAPSL